MQLKLIHQMHSNQLPCYMIIMICYFNNQMQICSYVILYWMFCHRSSVLLGYLIWPELSPNLLTSSTTGLSPFEACYGFQPLMFKHQKLEVDVPPAQQLVCRCQWLWTQAYAAFQPATDATHHNIAAVTPITRMIVPCW